MSKITLHRVWNITRSRYFRPNTSSNKFYANETGAKLGIKRFKETRAFKEDEFEIHEYTALPSELLDSIIYFITRYPVTNITRADIIQKLVENGLYEREENE